MGQLISSSKLNTLLPRRPERHLWLRGQYISTLELPLQTQGKWKHWIPGQTWESYSQFMSCHNIFQLSRPAGDKTHLYTVKRRGLQFSVADIAAAIRVPKAKRNNGARELRARFGHFSGLPTGPWRPSRRDDDAGSSASPIKGLHSASSSSSCRRIWLEKLRKGWGHPEERASFWGQLFFLLLFLIWKGRVDKANTRREVTQRKIYVAHPIATYEHLRRRGLLFLVKGGGRQNNRLES